MTSCFNAIGWQSRLANDRVSRRHLGMPLLTVEWRLQGRFERGPHDAEVPIQIEGSELMWKKERRLHLGIGQLPADVRTVAWLDDDVIFLDRGGLITADAARGAKRVIGCMANLTIPLLHLHHGDLERRRHFDHHVPMNELGIDTDGDLTRAASSPERGC